MQSSSTILVGVSVKRDFLFEEKDVGEVKKNACIHCRTTENKGKFCAICGLEIEKEFQDRKIVLRDHIAKRLSPKQVRKVNKEMEEEDIYEALSIFGSVIEDDDDELELLFIGNVILSHENYGWEVFNPLTDVQRKKLFQRFKKFGLAVKLSDIEYYHFNDYN